MCPEQHVQGNCVGAYFAYENVKVDVAAAAVGVDGSSSMLLLSFRLLLLLLLRCTINYSRFVFVDFPFQLVPSLTVALSWLFMFRIMNNNNNCCFIYGICLYKFSSLRWQAIAAVVVVIIVVVVFVFSVGLAAAFAAAKNAITNCFCFCYSAVVVAAAAAHFNTTFKFVALITCR